MKGDVGKRTTFLCLSVAVLVVRFVLRSVFPGGRGSWVCRMKNGKWKENSTD
jgi:hypothetical protein